MTQLESRDGVRCDLCHMILRDKFRYYSYDLKKTLISRGMAPSVLKANRKVNANSIDVCGICHDKFAKRIVNVNKILQQRKRRGRADCELSGEPILDGDAYQVFVTVVEVDIHSRNVTADANYLSFLISPKFLKEFELKPLSSEVSNWETKTNE